MRGYYYDQQTSPPAFPPRTPPPVRRPGRRTGGALAVLLLVLFSVLLVGAGALLRLWAGLETADLLGDTPNFRPPYSEEAEAPAAAETTVERAPTGDGTTLAISPLPDGLPHSLQEIYRENIRSIVSIRGYLDDGMNLGTGVIMSADGYVITNSHVIEGSGRVEVVLQDETVYNALLVGRDAASDLAVLKIDADGLSPAIFGDSTLLEVGDTVVAIGNPLGEELRGTMTDGIISAINRDVNVDGYTMSLLQTTAALNSGNSGGALINDHGQVVGITNLKMEGYDSTVEGLGFAIPTTTVKEVVDALIAYGQVENRPTIGITGYTVTAEMAAGFDGPQGVAVQTVREGSDAQMQGILPGDIIVEANGETITTMEQLQALKDSLSVGDVLSLRIWRSGHYLERDVTLVDQYTLDE